ncbi:MAG: class I SAM-dependent rRNA methyltransferase [Pseudomarimonas sp.]
MTISLPDYPPLFLRRGEDKRLRAGHLWVFSNEVDTKRSPLDKFAAGDPVNILDAGGHAVGSGYINPASLICARLMDRGCHVLDRSLLVHRLNVALSLRERLYGEPYYRLLFGESDGVPGLTVDRFGDVLVAQATSAGMERLKGVVIDALIAALKPAAIVWKNDSSAREIEGLTSYVEIAAGELPQRVMVREAGLQFAIDIIGGQKTGWFYDQRSNREAMTPWVKGARVLDLFSYVGAWGLRAAQAGASEVTCVDSSADAIAAVLSNAADNGLAAKVRGERGDVFEYLKAARAQRERWDVVIVDPPAFVKKRKDFKQGSLGYRRLNEAAMQVLAKDGLLVTASCSYHMGRPALLEAINAGGRHLDRQVQVLSQLQQSPDHPIQAAIPETDYLKGYICRVLPV